MAQATRHTITVCTDCRITGTACLPGLQLLDRLTASLSRFGSSEHRDFAVEGTVCMAACRRPCTIAFQASGKATYLFGDIAPDADIEALIDFARLYGGRVDGMTREAERPRALGGKVLARIPASILVAKSAGAHVQ